jgi:uncharacterized membrane protein YfcA
MTSSLSIWGWALLALGAFCVGISKTGVPGIGILNVAIFAIVLPSARHSVGVVLPILISADIIAVALYRRRAVWHHLWRLFPWAIAGIFIGFFAMPYLDDKQVARLLGVILLTLVGLTFVRKAMEKRAACLAANAEAAQAEAPVETLDEKVQHTSPIFTGIMGIAGGFTTMVGNAAGPIMTLYLLAMRLPKMEFIGTGAWYFLLLNIFKVPFMTKLGWIDGPSLALSARLAPCAVIGALCGRAIVPHIKQEWFEFTALALTVIAALRLLWS